MNFSKQYIIYVRFKLHEDVLWVIDPDHTAFKDLNEAIRAVSRDKTKWTSFEFAIAEISPNFIFYSEPQDIDELNNNKRILTL